MSYVDGFVLVVPKKKRAAYKKMANEGKRMWLKLGALSYRECRIDDAKPKWVTFTFPKMAKAKPSEEVWFSYIEYKDKKHRDKINKEIQKGMADAQKKGGKSQKQMMLEMPFDMKRMAYAGFTVEVAG
jgi:alkaline phosphatase